MQHNVMYMIHLIRKTIVSIRTRSACFYALAGILNWRRACFFLLRIKKGSLLCDIIFSPISKALRPLRPASKPALMLLF